MKGLDVLIVRFIPFVLFIIFGINLLNACIGKEPFISYDLHGNSVIYAIGLFIISLANRRYHCIWNRAMYVFLIALPLFNYLDTEFSLVPETNTYIWVVIIIYAMTALITAFLAIRHFIQMSKRRLTNGGK